MNAAPRTQAPAAASDAAVEKMAPRARDDWSLRVKDVAAYLGVSVDYVYQHAAELGARRLGAGRKPRLRFNLAEVDRRALNSCLAGRGSDVAESRTVEPKRAHRRRQGSGTTAPLLPIRGVRGG